MQAHPAIQPSTFAGTGAPSQRLQARFVAGVVTGLVVLTAAFTLAQPGAGDGLLAQRLQDFQHRVAGSAVQADAGTPTRALADRYLAALEPGLRHRITDQVRAEQRAGTTPAGNDAFVMRRLELYEAALQQAQAAPAP